MAKIIKKKKKFRLNTLITTMFIISIVGYVSSVTFLRSYNISLSYDLASISSSNEDNSKKLETLRLDVAKYTEKEYLMSMSNENGSNLKLDQNNIVRIVNETE